METPFTVRAATPSGTLIFATASRTKAIAIFPSRETAEAFAMGYHAIELEPLELTADKIHDWTENVRSHGVTHAIINPPLNGEARRAAHASLEAVLNAALGNEVQEQKPH